MERLKTLLEKARGGGSTAVVARGALGALVVRVLGAGTAFGMHVVTARLLGPEDYGKYAFVLSWATVLASVSRLGMVNVALRFGAGYVGREQWSMARGVFRWSLGLSLAAGALAGVALAAGAALLAHDPSIRSAFFLGAVFVPVFGVGVVMQSVLHAFQRVLLTVTAEFILVPAFMSVLLLGAFWLGGEQVGAGSAIGLHAVAWALAILALVVGWRQVRTARFEQATAEYEVRRWLKAAPSFWVMGLSGVVRAQFDVILVGTLLGTTEAGTYAIAKRVGGLARHGFVALIPAVSPMFAKLYEQKQARAFTKLLVRSTLGMLALSGAIAAVLLGGGRWFLVAFGNAYVQAYPVMAIVVLGQVASAVAGPSNQALAMTDREREVLLIQVGSTLGYAALCAAFIPWFGAFGAAAALSLSLGGASILLLARARKAFAVFWKRTVDVEPAGP